MRDQLERILQSAVTRVHAGDSLARFVREGGQGEIRIGDRVIAPGAGIWIAALGKAAPQMSSRLETIAKTRVRGGITIAPEGHFQGGRSLLTEVEAGHPIPDRKGEEAARKLLALVERIPSQDVLVVLLSGGTSSLTSCPAAGLTLEDLQKTTELLLLSGVAISDMNSVRKHCSRIAGGRLAAASGTRTIEVLAVSDVPDDDPAVIGSGPCSPDATTFSDALGVIKRFGLESALPARVMSHLRSGNEGKTEESLSPGHPGLVGVHYEVIASNRDARLAACVAAEKEGLRAIDLGEILHGEASEVGRRLGALAASLKVSEPTLLVAGGETVVKVRGQGRGGRNQELVLAAAQIGSLEASGRNTAIMAVGTDGRDGPTPAAGAFADHRTMEKARRAGLDALSMLDDNDSYGFFSSVGDDVVTGPTGTNVMDLALVLVGGDDG